MIPNAKNKRVVKNETILDVKAYFLLIFFGRFFFFAPRRAAITRKMDERGRARWSGVKKWVNVTGFGRLQIVQ